MPCTVKKTLLQLEQAMPVGGRASSAKKMLLFPLERLTVSRKSRSQAGENMKWAHFPTGAK